MRRTIKIWLNNVAPVLSDQVANRRRAFCTDGSAVVRAIKDLYGRGPTHAKTYLCDEYVFCVMT